MRAEASLTSPFARLGAWLARHARPVLVVFAGLFVLAAVYGASVLDHLPAGGFEVTGSESERASREAAHRFGIGSADLLVLYSDPEADLRDARFGSQLFDLLEPVLADPGVVSATTYYDTGEETLVSRDGHDTLVIISLAGDDDQKLPTFRRIEPMLHAVEPPLKARIGGPVAISMLAQEIARNDAARAEAVALPIAALLTLLFFRSVIAALLPIGIGGFALAASAALTRFGAQFTEISVFAMNVGAFLGLGLSIDYALLLVQRFREEIDRGLAVPDAVATTLDTAGRSVWVSGLTVAVSLAALIPVSLPVMRSVAIGGVLVVATALVGAVLLLPALLGWLGPGVNRWPVGRSRIASGPSPFWGRVGGLSMRHPVLAALASLVVLGALASPVVRMRSVAPDSRAFARDSDVRRIDEVLEDPARFDPRGASAIPIVIETPGSPLSPENLRSVAAYAARVAEIPGVSVRTPLVELASLAHDPAALRTRMKSEPIASQISHTVSGDMALLVAQHPNSWRSPAASRVVHAIRALSHPGFDLWVGGATAQMEDLQQALRDYARIAVVLIGAWNLLILLGAFRSIVVPIKAVVMNAISLGASYGLLVWVFQDGHFSHWLGFEPVDGLDPTIPLIMFAVVFGLSMDYEVFLLSRIQEEWLRTRDNRASVTRGLAFTGRTITSAAMILLVVVGAFASGDLVYVKQMGVGIGAAVALDVTLVRALLVPATMQLLGEWNWWAPRWMRPSTGVERGSAPQEASPG